MAGIGVQAVYLVGGPRKQEQRNKGAKERERGREAKRAKGGGEERHTERETAYKRACTCNKGRVPTTHSGKKDSRGACQSAAPTLHSGERGELPLSKTEQ